MPPASVSDRRLSVEVLENRITPATFIVTNLSDSGAGSLREAINLANDEANHPGADLIVFGPTSRGGTVNLSTCTNLSAGTTAVPQPAGPSAFLITSAITIRGTGETIARSSIVGTADFRMFQVTAAGSLTLQNLTLSNGIAHGGAALTGGGGAGLGGAIYNQGTLNILGSTLTGNQAIGGGNADVGGSGGGGLGGDASNNGGGPNGGTFGGGSTGGLGGFGGGGGGGSIGGIGGFGGGGGGSTGTIGGKGGFGGGGGAGTSNGGQAGFGGGFGGAAFGGAGNFLGGGGGGMGGAVFNQGGTVTVADSTLAGNTAVGADTIGAGAHGGSAFGGGIFSLNGSLTLTNATIAGNVVSHGHGFQDGDASGGAVYIIGLNVGVTPTQNAVITLDNSILGNSTGGPDLVFGIGDSVPSIQTHGGRTIVTTSIPLTPAVLPGNLDVVPDVKLGALQNNGGFTATMLPQSGSTAINTGLNSVAGSKTDQRGGNYLRVSGGTIDVGAVEAQPTPPPPPPGASLEAILVGGAANGTAVVLNQSGGTYSNAGRATFFPGSIGTVRTTSADVNGDGTPDYIGGGGPGGGPRVAVIDGATGTRLADFFAFEQSFLGGVFVATGDLDHDGRSEVIVTPDQGGGPRVEIFSFTNGSPIVRANFFGIDDKKFRGGARSAVGDVNKDGSPDLLIAAGFGGGPRVALFNGSTLFTTRTKLVNDFFAFPEDAATLRNGIFAALGDISGDGFADLVFGGGPGGAPRVYILSGQLLTVGSPNLFSQPVANFFVAGNAKDRGGVRLAVKNSDGDTKADLVVGSGERSPAKVRAYLGTNFIGTGEPASFQDLPVFGGAVLSDGVYVG